MIELWKEAVVENAALYVGWGGLLIGIVFGFIVYRTNFCTMGSISDILSFGDYRRFRSWLLAAGTGMVGVALIASLGMADIGASMYLTPNFIWLANIVGGLLFGFGMVFSGGCISRNLVRAGGGDLRSVVVLLITGIFAYATIGGLIGPLRAAVVNATTLDLTAMGAADQSVGGILSGMTGMDAGTAAILSLVVVAGGIFIYCFKDAQFRGSFNHVAAGVGIGLCVVAGWALTGLAHDEFGDVEVAVGSLTYTRPAGDTLEWFMRYTALGAPGFAVVTTIGALLGGLLGALSRGRVHLTTFADKDDSIRNMFGAALMGIGGVLALGCTVGQAVTGVSTLAIGSILTFACIVLGGIIGVKVFENIA